MKKISTLYMLLVLLAMLVQSNDIMAQCQSLTLKPGPDAGIHAHITQNHPTQNVGHDTVFMAFHWTILSVPVESRGLMKFDLSQIPIGATITSAQLNLYADTTSARGYANQPTFGANNACNLMRVTAPWDRNYVTWNTAPATTTTGAVTLQQSTNYTENYLGVDVTNFAQQWVNDPNTNYGMLLQMITTSAYNSMIFCSSDFPDSTLWPSLQICYIPQAPCNTKASFTYQHLGSGVVQFNNTSTSDSGYYSSWVFYNTDGIFATSNNQNPTITYTGTQPFYASLTVIDSAYSQCINSTDSLIDITTCIEIKPGPTDGYHAHITSLQPSLNYGVVPEFMSIEWTNNSVPYEGRSLMKFDLSQIPTGSTITGALLDLFADTTSTSSYPGQPMYGNNNASNLFEITSVWDKNTVTWNNQPTTNPANPILLGQTRGSNDYLAIDLATFAQDWVNNPAQNNGMLLQMITQSYYNSMIFCSSDYPDSSLWPTLRICYIKGRLDTTLNDTLCGFVFIDQNHNGVYDSFDIGASNNPVTVDGNIVYTDSFGYYTAVVSAGQHQIAVVPPFGWSQTLPVSPPTYTITTSTNQHICGFDFGITNSPSGINNIGLANADMVVFPNPLNGNAFHIRLPDNFEATNTSVSVEDMLGRDVATQYSAVQQKQLNVTFTGQLTPGVYTIVVKNDKQRLCGKLSIIK